MSLISLSYPDSSELIAKDCASIVVDQMSAMAPVEARASRSSLAMSLENLYRLLEMFKYHSYADEPRRGVLMLEQDDVSVQDRSFSTQHWQDRITPALEACIKGIYPDLARTDAIERLQGSLRAVAKGENVGAEERSVKEFFVAFRDSI